MRLASVWLLAMCASAACGDTRVDSSLELTDAGADGGAIEVHAHWAYTSGKVDVDIEVTTAHGDACATTARLTVDKALSARDVYRLPKTPCDTLRIGDDGDLVLFDAPTGHDWTSERIRVDSDRERIMLGPWRDAADDVTYGFVLTAPECPDDDGCDCPRLERSANGELMKLELGRRCD